MDSWKPGYDIITHIHVIETDKIADELFRLNRYFEKIQAEVELVIPLPIGKYLQDIHYINIKGCSSVIKQFIRHERFGFKEEKGQN